MPYTAPQNLLRLTREVEVGSLLRLKNLRTGTAHS